MFNKMSSTFKKIFNYSLKLLNSCYKVIQYM